jgi:predicted DNA-binding protein
MEAIMEKVRMTLRLIKPLDEQLKEISRKTGRSRNDLIIAACWEFINHIEQRKDSDTHGKNKHSRY